MEARSREPYPTDVTDEEWAFVAPYLALLPEDAGQRRYALREVFNALRWIVRAGAPWRLLPHELPPSPVIYQQTQRWITAGRFEALVQHLHGIRLEVVKHTEAKHGFVLLPRRWVVERSFAWAARFRRLARDYERLPETLAGLHFIAFACLLLSRMPLLLLGSLPVHNTL